MRSGEQRTALEVATAPGLHGWSQSFTVPAGTPQVLITFDDGVHTLLLWVQIIAILVTIVLALPARRGEPDLDADAGSDDTGSADTGSADAGRALDGPDEAGLNEIGLDEIGLDEIGLDERSDSAGEVIS